MAAVDYMWQQEDTTRAMSVWPAGLPLVRPKLVLVIRNIFRHSAIWRRQE